MKKIVFLLCLFVLATPSVVKGVESFPCNGGFLEVKRTRFDTGEKSEITKIGENAFRDTLQQDNMEYYVNDALCTEDRYIVYGYTHSSEYETYYDNLLVVYDYNGEKLLEERSDYEELEEIKNVFYMNQTYFVVIHQTYDDGQYQHIKNIIEVRDKDFNMINTIHIMEEIFRFKEQNNMLIMKYDNEVEYNIGIKTDGSLVNKNDVVVIEHEYEGSMSIDFLNEATLNGEVVENGIVIEYPGNYEFTYNDYVYDFVVHPIITGVNNGDIIKDEVILSYSGGNGILNNEPYMSGSVIDLPGNYLFVVYGPQDYTKEIQFTISANIEGITNGHRYDKDVDIVFNGEGYLNNNFVNSPLNVSEIGDYVLMVKGANGYLDKYEFSVVEPDNTNSLSGIIKNLDIFLVVVVVIMGVIVIKKK